MTATQSLNLYNLSLKYFKSETDAVSFVKEIEMVVDNKFDYAKDTLATKEDLANSKADTLKWMFVMFLPFYVGMIVFLIKAFNK
jgi:hypothetical protein